PRDLPALGTRDVLDYDVGQLRLTPLPFAHAVQIRQLADVANVLGRELRVDGGEDAGRHVPPARRLAILREREPRHEPPVLLGEAVPEGEDRHVPITGAPAHRPHPGWPTTGPLDAPALPLPPPL